ncbi:tetratricopeptide repeat protein [Nonomuraea africana]|uniref:tetratricopeptide repeat protein n=1 Tax=Nonomuraea africana TaxID=46171 RepID=UPI0033C6D106
MATEQDLVRFRTEAAHHRDAEGYATSLRRAVRARTLLIESGMAASTPEALAGILLMEGGLRRHLGDLARAVRVLNEALTLAGRGRATTERVRPLRSIQAALRVRGAALAPTLNNLALLRKDQGDSAEAAALYRRAMAILEDSVSPDHPLALACRANHA